VAFVTICGLSAAAVLCWLKIAHPFNQMLALSEQLDGADRAPSPKDLRKRQELAAGGMQESCRDSIASLSSALIGRPVIETAVGQESSHPVLISSRH
jgi:hypothetical protein